jgi:nitrile hydratase
MAVTVAMGASGQWNIDLSRAARESLPPAIYLSSSYYEIWIRALEKLMLERGMVTPAELATGQQSTPPIQVNKVLTSETVDAALKAGSPTERPIDQPALFKVGQKVRARNMHPQGHTRLPRYVRGHVGTVVSLHGGHVFPDGHTLHASPPFNVPVQWLYTVVFDGPTLWGEHSDPTLEVTVDAWESYLEAAA